MHNSGLIQAVNKWFLFLISLFFGFCSTHAASEDFRGLSRSQQNEVISSLTYGQSHALLIGNSDYQSAAWSDLPSVKRELDELEEVLSREFTVERADNLNGIELRDKLREFVVIHGQDPSSRLLIYFAGHGYSDSSKTQGYLVPVDAPNPEQEKDDFLRKIVPMQHITASARESQAKHILYLFDSCFSARCFKHEHPCLHLPTSAPKWQSRHASSSPLAAPMRLYPLAVSLQKP